MRVALGHFGRRLETLDLDLGEQPLDLARLDQPGPEALGRLRAAGHAEAQALGAGEPV